MLCRSLTKLPNCTFSYLRDVELLTPGFDCPKHKQVAPYPYRVTGASTGYVDGQILVCGGATVDYMECHEGYEQNYYCDRNVECVKTTGGTQWCSGPKVNKCFTLDVPNNVRKIHAAYSNMNILFVFKGMSG